jgi:very-short-patch-repair endonuclease
MPNISHYNKGKKYFARRLRNESTFGEIILWSRALRAKEMLGYQFNRQFPIDNYIVDFICRKLKLIIELDGYSHDFKYDKDRVRDLQLNELGYFVLRFTEQQVRHDLDNVVAAIEQTIEEFEAGKGQSPLF